MSHKKQVPFWGEWIAFKDVILLKKGLLSKEKNVPFGSKIFPYRVDRIFKSDLTVFRKTDRE